jgi:hypothetical protein
LAIVLSTTHHATSTQFARLFTKSASLVVSSAKRIPDLDGRQVIMPDIILFS